MSMRRFSLILLKNAFFAGFECGQERSERLHATV